MIVYADVLFGINFMINYLVLYAAARIGRLHAPPWRLAAGAACGAVYAVLLFFPRLHFWYSLAGKFLVSLAVVAVTYRIRHVRLYIKAVGIFYLVTFCLGGGVMAIFSFTGIGAKLGAVVKNGIFYMDLPFALLMCAVFLSYALIRLVWRMLYDRITGSNALVKVGIRWNGKEVWLDALLDTGNSLTDPLTDSPVIVAEYKGLAPILPPELREAWETDAGKMPERIRDPAVRGRLRVIPFSSIGKEHGMLLGFRPDSAVVLENESIRELGNVVVGICGRALSRDHSYGALMHPRLLPQ